MKPGTLAWMAAATSLLAVPPALAAEWEWNASLSNRGEFKKNFLDTSDQMRLKFDQEGKGYYFYAVGGVEGDFDSWSFTLTLDSGIIRVPALYRQVPEETQVTSNGNAVADEARETGFVRELYIDADLAPGGALTLAAGKYNASVGRDFIYNDYTFGARAEIDLLAEQKVPFRASLEAVVSDGTFTAAGKRSPLLSAEAAYKFGKGEEAGVLFAYFHDGDDYIGEVVKPFVSEYLQYGLVSAAKHGKQSGKVNPNLLKLLGAIENQCGGDLDTCLRVENTGELFWTGVFANKIFRRFTLEGTAILNFGSANLDPILTMGVEDVHIYEKQAAAKKVRQGASTTSTSPSDKEILSYMADVDVSFEFVTGYSLNAFFLYLSGDNNFEKVSNNQMSAFISVLPYITKTNIFFSGGMNESASARALSTSGVNAHGVIAPGIGVTAEPVGDVLDLKLGWAMLFADKINSTYASSKAYGWELNFEADWAATSWLDVMLQADFFKTGAFFNHPEDYDPYGGAPTVDEPDPWRVLLGVDVHYDSEK
ncbi:MAG: hypothetical protein HY897_03385 [Deltaproteobacteria bacterium]|nr:hypothetical protein [Deltaproteobacteria bacterium]